MLLFHTVACRSELYGWIYIIHIGFKTSWPNKSGEINSLCKLNQSNIILFMYIGMIRMAYDLLSKENNGKMNCLPKKLQATS